MLTPSTPDLCFQEFVSCEPTQRPFGSWASWLTFHSVNSVHIQTRLNKVYNSLEADLALVTHLTPEEREEFIREWNERNLAIFKKFW